MTTPTLTDQIITEWLASYASLKGVDRGYGARAGETITGNLARGGDGKFASGGDASKPAAARRVGAKPGATRQAPARQSRRRASTRSTADPKKREAERQAKLAAREAERQATRAQREEERQGDRAKRDALRSQDREERRRERDARRAEAAQGRAARQSAPKPEAKPRESAEERTARREQEQSAKREANRAKVGESGTIPQADHDALMKLAGGAGVTQADMWTDLGGGASGLTSRDLEGLAGAGLVERDNEGKYRVSQAGRAYVAAANAGDVGRAQGAASRASDRAAASREREAKRQPSETPEQREARREARRAERTEKRRATVEAASVIPANDHKALMDMAGGATPDAANLAGLVGSGLVEQDAEGAYFVSDAGRSYIAAANAGDVSRARDAKSRAANRTARAREGQGQQADRANQQAANARAAEVSREARRREREARRGMTRKERAPSPIADFTIKQVGGRWRWTIISSTAYRDRDGEFVTKAALAGDVARKGGPGWGSFGPLRWWHLGEIVCETPGDWTSAKAGRGVDIGDCDFQMLSPSGLSLIESGGFRSEAIGAAVAQRAGELGASLGFARPANEPDAGRAFHNINRCERSLLPRDRASNYYTQVAVAPAGG